MTLDVEPSRFDPPPITMLIVGPSALETVLPLPELRTPAFEVIAADDFATAKAFLLASPPRLLITDVRLHDYNGLHLVLRAKAAAPWVAALVLSPYYDPVLESEGHALGATFVVTPVDPKELAAAVRRTLFRVDDTIVRTPFERRVTPQPRGSLPVGLDGRPVERRKNAPNRTGLPLEFPGNGELA